MDSSDTYYKPLDDTTNPTTASPPMMLTGNKNKDGGVGTTDGYHQLTDDNLVVDKTITVVRDTDDNTSPALIQSAAKQTATSLLEMSPIINTPSVTSFFNSNNGGGAGISSSSTLGANGSFASHNNSSKNNSSNNNNNSNGGQLAVPKQLPPAPLVRASMHLLQPNGSILGRDVAMEILPQFQDLLCAIPAGSHRDALACIDGRAAISHQRIYTFLIHIGSVLHDKVKVGRGDRIAVVLPNGPELALAILAVACWASCVPLNAFAASAELQSDLEKSGADCIIGMDPTRTGSGSEIQQLATQLNIPFCGLVPDSDYAGLFELIPPNENKQFPRSVVVPPSSPNSAGVTPLTSPTTPLHLKACHGNGCDQSGPPGSSNKTMAAAGKPETLIIDTPTDNETNAGSIGNGQVLLTKENKKIVEEVHQVIEVGVPCHDTAERMASEIVAECSNEANLDSSSPPVAVLDAAATGVPANSKATELLSDAQSKAQLFVDGNSVSKPEPSLRNQHTSTLHDDIEQRERRRKKELPNQHDDEVLVLFTSGTTGSKKLVPHLLADVLVATACISVSWKLTPNDTNCNLMPLFHVGGIIRQVFSPVLSGGCVICCPSFDPLTFWHLMTKNNDPGDSSCSHRKAAFTWYYAAPTMHQLILQTGRAEGHIPDYRNDGSNPNSSVNSPSNNGVPKPRLKMIANAAGGLLPSLARELRQAFGANVLPSYGMTECMPITSPPANYQLEKPGTSGVAVGPELAILNIDTLETMETGKEGPICVRHEPCFRGYGIIQGDGVQNQEKPVTFLLDTQTGESSGWFDTGDLGYMDSDGYLYITGRSKEVINRGGEIISPMEVEEAIIAHPDVEACAAFSTAHSVLQEVVGLLMVPVPGRPRLDLTTLHEYLGQGRLAAPKWPQCLVYMDGGLPKSFTNKLLRVKLGNRLSLPELNDNMYMIERTFQAKCPPIGTAVSVAIPCERVSVNATQVQVTLQQQLLTDRDQQELIVVSHPSKIGALVAYVYNIDRYELIQVARANIDAYMVPTHVCLLAGPLDRTSNNKNNVELIDEFLPPPQPSDAIGSILQEEISKGAGPTNPLVTELQELMQMMLDLDCLPAPGISFFNVGGSSMLASQLASKVRKLYNIPFGGAEVFHHSTCEAIACVIRERQGGGLDGVGRTSSHNGGQVSESGGSAGGNPASMAASSLFSKKLDLSRTPFEHSRLEIQPGYFTILVQLIPLFVIYPMWSLTRIFLFFQLLLAVLNHTPGDYPVMKFIATLVFFHACWVVITPLFFILCKWTIIGKYRHGRYPIWGSYYLRWWLVDIMRKLIGKGAWGSHDWSLNIYYRLLGANIGEGARISAGAEIAEYDLVFIGDGAAIEISTVRAFGIDNGAMILGPVRVGDNASVGARSVVAPYTSIPDNAHLGPVSASYEISAITENGNDAQNIRYNRQALPMPSACSQFFVIGSIMFVVNAFAHIPALAVLILMLNQAWNYDRPFQSTGHMLEWLCDVRRIPFFIGIRIARSTLSPFFYMFMAILVKWCIIGKFEPGPRDTKSEWQLIRHRLALQLFTRESMQEVSDLVGRHYYLVSILYRLLGAKVGKRVFWPGRQPLFTGEFDLLEIGDDVVFGSRTSLFCTTVDSAEKIILCAGSNISDNTVVLPGSIIGKGAVLGSNTICPAGRYLPEASIWLGSRVGQPILLEKGVEDFTGPVFAADIKTDKLQMQGDETTIRPFGKAFYNGEASYFVYPLPLIISFTFATRVLVSTLNALPVLGALHLAAGFFYGWPARERDYLYIDFRMEAIYPVLLAFYVITHFVHAMIWLAVEVGSKWTFMGLRREGRFNYDTSPYAQNWELYQITSKVRDLGRLNFLDFICGTPFIVSYFRMLGCQIGSDCCLYPAGGDPYMPEPDLVEIGDRCVIDCASVVCHLNTRGNFELAKIRMQSNVTLRTRARIQQAVYMESGSMLLEKSLAMTGEIIEADSVWYGGPAARLLNYDSSSISSRPSAAGASFSGSQDAGAYV